MDSQEQIVRYANLHKKDPSKNMDKVYNIELVCLDSKANKYTTRAWYGKRGASKLREHILAAGVTLSMATKFFGDKMGEQISEGYYVVEQGNNLGQVLGQVAPVVPVDPHIAPDVDASVATLDQDIEIDEDELTPLWPELPIMQRDDDHLGGRALVLVSAFDDCDVRIHRLVVSMGMCAKAPNGTQESIARLPNGIYDVVVSAFTVRIFDVLAISGYDLSGMDYFKRNQVLREVAEIHGFGGLICKQFGKGELPNLEFNDGPDQEQVLCVPSKYTGEQRKSGEVTDGLCFLASEGVETCTA